MKISLHQFFRENLSRLQGKFQGKVVSTRDSLQRRSDQLLEQLVEREELHTVEYQFQPLEGVRSGDLYQQAGSTYILLGKEKQENRDEHPLSISIPLYKLFCVQGQNARIYRVVSEPALVRGLPGQEYVRAGYVA
ncbi:MAG: hypothetical protein AABX13_02990 [Nanoarchaeota archaeon]